MQGVSFPFVEVVERQRMLVAFQPLLWSKVLSVPGNVRVANFVNLLLAGRVTRNFYFGI